MNLLITSQVPRHASGYACSHSTEHPDWQLRPEREREREEEDERNFLISAQRSANRKKALFSSHYFRARAREREEEKNSCSFAPCTHTPVITCHSFQHSLKVHIAHTDGHVQCFDRYAIVMVMVVDRTGKREIDL